MAAANLDTNKKVGKFNTVNVGTGLTAFNATDGAEYTPTKGDERVMVVIYNSDTTNNEVVTIKAPTNRNKVGGAIADTAVTVTKGETALIMVESAKYVDIVTGKVKLTGSADVKAQVYEI